MGRYHKSFSGVKGVLMYCSLRVYVDKISDSVSTQNILNLFELFSNTFGWSYDYITYMLFDPEKEGTLIDKKYSYDSVGKNGFLNANIVPLVTGQHGDLSAPFITAACIEEPPQLYSGHRVQIQFPISSELFVIRVDYEQKDTQKLTLETYNFLIQSLAEVGFCVNNGFYHVYRNKNEAVTLDGGQIGSLISYCGYANLSNYLIHRQKDFRNRLMCIYCANSICTDSLGKDMLESIVNIVGSSNVILENNICSFSLGNMQKSTPSYRIRYAVILIKLQRLFKTVTNRQ